MDFFGEQDRAKAATRKLLVFYALAVLGTILAVYAASVLILGAVEHERTTPTWQATPDTFTSGLRAPFSHGGWFDPALFLGLTTATGLVIALGSAWKASQFASGGAAVASLLGGRPVARGSRQPSEQRLLNVVEEMALASGLPVPEVWMLDGEETINAFAAGHRPGDAVIGVTRGAAEQLTRDELQGVIAHEFSHILHGDMRLNMRLSVLTHGILCLALLGREVLGLVPRLPFRSSRKNGGVVAVAAAMVLTGCILLVIGSLGHAFARLIQAAVSRQREFLADAAAVQFTRNPAGLADALGRIASIPRTRLRTSHAAELGHFLFASGCRNWFGGLTATHPPLEERIQRIDPSFDPDRLRAPASSPLPPSRGPAEPPARAPSLVLPETATLAAALGRPEPEHLAEAGDRLRALPEPLRQAANDSLGAQALVLALFPASTSPGTPSALENEILRLRPFTETLDARLKLPLIDLAIPALRPMTHDQYLGFRRELEARITADAQIDLFEFTLQHILKRHLDPGFGVAAPPSAPSTPAVLETAVPALRSLLGAVAYAAHDATTAPANYASGVRALDLAALSAALPAADECHLAAVAEALDTLARLPQPDRGRVLFAAAQVAAEDDRLEIAEAELLRALADALDCPLPPLLEALET